MFVSYRYSLILPFFDNSKFNHLHSEGIIGNLFYFIVATLIIAALLLFINSYFSLSVKYLDKGGGFECGFTSFVQTRERFNVIFYRVSLLFLVFDLEIILIFPYTAIYQKYQNISKNNGLVINYIIYIPKSNTWAKILRYLKSFSLIFKYDTFIFLHISPI